MIGASSAERCVLYGACEPVFSLAWELSPDPGTVAVSTLFRLVCLEGSCGAVEVMEVVWPSGAALRGEASNRPQVHWLKTVVLNVVGKGAARPRQVWVGKMSDRRKSSAVDVSKAGKTTSKPGLLLRPGMSLGGTRLLPRRRPAYRQHEPDQGASTARVKACQDTAAGIPAARGRTPSGRIREGQSTDRRARRRTRP